MSKAIVSDLPSAPQHLFAVLSMSWVGEQLWKWRDAVTCGGWASVTVN